MSKYQNNSCSRANKGVEESALKRQPAATKERKRNINARAQRGAFLDDCIEKRKFKNGSRKGNSLGDGAISFCFCETNSHSYNQSRESLKICKKEGNVRKSTVRCK